MSTPLFREYQTRHEDPHHPCYVQGHANCARSDFSARVADAGTLLYFMSPYGFIVPISSSAITSLCLKYFIICVYVL